MAFTKSRRSFFLVFAVLLFFQSIAAQAKRFKLEKSGIIVERELRDIRLSPTKPKRASNAGNSTARPDGLRRRTVDLFGTDVGYENLESRQYSYTCDDPNYPYTNSCDPSKCCATDRCCPGSNDCFDSSTEICCNDGGTCDLSANCCIGGCCPNGGECCSNGNCCDSPEVCIIDYDSGDHFCGDKSLIGGSGGGSSESIVVPSYSLSDIGSYSSSYTPYYTSSEYTSTSTSYSTSYSYSPVDFSPSSSPVSRTSFNFPDITPPPISGGSGSSGGSSSGDSGSGSGSGAGNGGNVGGVSGGGSGGAQAAGAEKTTMSIWAGLFCVVGGAMLLI